MQKEIVLNGEVIQFFQKVSKRSRGIRISIRVDGSVTLTHPRFASNARVEKFIQDKSSWILSKLAHFRSFDRSLVDKEIKMDFKKDKYPALRFVENKVRELNQFYNFSFKNINVRDQKTRWGSCSRQGRLSFNFRIVHLPVRLAEYIVVHELCHLKEFNHSKKFWDLVAKTFPDYQVHRASLKKMITH